MISIRFFYFVAAQISLCICLSLVPLQAAFADSIYSVKVPIKAQSATALGDAFKKGMQVVMLRLVGQSQLLDEKPVKNAQKQALAKADKYVATYNYESTEQGLAVHITYNHKAMDNLLSSQGLPIWTGNRPMTLVWLAINHGGQREIVTNESEDLLLTKLGQVGEQYGVPLMFPLMDLQDQSHISMSDVWGLFNSVLLKASRRYGNYSVLAGKVTINTSNQVSGSWLYLLNGQPTALTLNHVSPEVFVQKGVDLVASGLSALLSVSSQLKADTIPIRVFGLDSLTQYVNLSNYLSSISQVKDLRLAEIKKGVSTLEISLEGPKERLLELLAMQGKLQRVELAVNKVDTTSDTYDLSIQNKTDPAVTGLSQLQKVEDKVLLHTQPKIIDFKWLGN